MKPIKFNEANKKFIKTANMTDEECKSLWVYTDGEQCISCWKMTFKQRISALIHGKVWLSVLSGQTQPPVWVDCAKTVFIKKETQIKVLFEKWWDNYSKSFGIRNHKQTWKEDGIKPKISYHTNGGKRKSGDKCFDATLTIGYTIFNYTNWDLQKEWSVKNAK